MPVILPLIAYIEIFWLCRLRTRDWRAGVLEAATCWGVALTLITELLSIPRWVTRGGLSCAWIVVCLSCGYLLWQYGRRRDSREQNPPIPDRVSWCLLGGVGVVLALVGITAVLSPPNTWDAMAYHMSRIVQWMTNRDVFFYPTFYSAQLFLSPWAEYAMLHLDLLYGGDRLVNLVEWFSFAGSIAGVSLIAKSLGADKRGQILAAVAAATLPEAILESSGAMNTGVGAFWIVAAVYFALQWRERQDWPTLFFTGGSIGLALFTKGTAWLFLPFPLIACWLMAAPLARRRLLWRSPVCILVVLVLNGPLFVRNYRLSGSPLGFASPLGDDPQRQYENSRFSAPITAANAVKNLALHMGTPSDAVNGVVEKSVAWTLHAMHSDPDDPESTYRGGFRMNRMSNDESTAGNPLQLVLIAAACLLAFIGGRDGNRDLRWYAAGMFGAFILFCAVLRWQPWNSRYHLPVFELGCALAGVAWSKYGGRWIPAALGAVLLLSALPFALANSLRPLAPWRPDSVLAQTRGSLYFTDFHESIADSYAAVAREIKSSPCRNIGVDGSLQDFDYPLFALLDAGRSAQRIEYTGVNNLTSGFGRPEERPPCVVICLRCVDAPQKWTKYRSTGGRVSVYGGTAVFSAAGRAANSYDAEPADSQVHDARELLEEMDGEVAALRTMDVRPTGEAALRAAARWPGKKADLMGRLDALYMERVDCWRVRHSADPMRRRGEPMDGSGADYDQARAAEQTLRSWVENLPEKAREIQALAAQLDDSWQSVLVGFQARDDKTAGCRIEVRTTGREVDPLTRKVDSSEEERWLDVGTPACSALEGHAGQTIEKKSLGQYDSEAVRFQPLSEALELRRPIFQASSVRRGAGNQ